MKAAGQLETLERWMQAVVMHPGPMNRGVEIAGEVADLPRSVVTRQVANGVAVRMAVLFLLLTGGTST